MHFAGNISLIQKGRSQLITDQNLLFLIGMLIPMIAHLLAVALELHYRLIDYVVGMLLFISVMYGILYLFQWATYVPQSYFRIVLEF